MPAARLKPALFALLPVVLAACVTGPLTLDDDLVVPGQRIGEVQIGMPLATLMAVKGNPITTQPIAGTEATTYTFRDGLTVGAHDEVYWIIAEDARFHTAAGVRPGVEQIFARASFGKPRCVESRGDTTVYDYGNIYFDVDNQAGKVRRLGVVGENRPCDKG